MTKVLITTSLLDDLADAIAAKSGESTPLTIAEMTDAVDDITLPSGSVNISTNGSHDVAAYETAVVSVPAPAPSLQTKTNISPSESSQTITADTGYDGLNSVQINAISSSYVGSGVTRRDSDDLTASGATVTAPAGYYASAASKSVASGTAGTPSATKGTVSNHSVTVTPSVTNTAGYISGGTKTGAAVTVTASELISFSTIRTGSSAPSSSLGVDGDIYIQTS